MCGQKGRVIRGGRVCKRSGGLVSFAPVLAVGVMALGAGGALAQAAWPYECITPPVGGPADTEMCSLGTLTGGTSSDAKAVSADGSVVVGQTDSSIGSVAFRWVEGGTGGDAGNPQMEDIGTLDGGSSNSAIAYDVNADGTVVVGHSYSLSGGGAFRWVEGGTAGISGNPQMENLGALNGTGTSYAYGVNADGSVVVGKSDSAAGTRAFRWVEGVGMQNLGTLDGLGISEAHDVNADGTVVVGYSLTSLTRAFRWVEGGTAGLPANPQMQTLGFLSGHLYSYAYGVNDAGTVVVGYSTALPGNSGNAFRWVEGGDFGGTFPQMQNLGTLDGDSWSYANDVNADGTVVVGTSVAPSGASTRAFRWVEDGTEGDAGNPQMQDLGSLDGSSYTEAHGVSADGSIVVG
ncbi:hypothetical protein [Sinisalibacter lacisalsi]|uniref:HAF repeat-containing protein n=1 Tax=Sinisalibacter lacisalsi TaxID=1526570 RepID=A0ABQ1QK85_9RHOB|nr:hypothetical protein [Sinisalibacter lacisalsi]GGD29420.1 hypothetical protein GCM10011358_11800 [Sinisalibacter lacisalsi]